MVQELSGAAGRRWSKLVVQVAGGGPGIARKTGSGSSSGCPSGVDPGGRGSAAAHQAGDRRGFRALLGNTVEVDEAPDPGALSSRSRSGLCSRQHRYAGQDLYGEQGRKRNGPLVRPVLVEVTGPRARSGPLALSARRRGLEDSALTTPDLLRSQPTNAIGEIHALVFE